MLMCARGKTYYHYKPFTVFGKKLGDSEVASKLKTFSSIEATTFEEFRKVFYEFKSVLENDSGDDGNFLKSRPLQSIFASCVDAP